MAWHNVRQALKLTGKARSTLYRDMAKGRVSYRSEPDGSRMLETSELIRVYGELRQVETEKRHSRGQYGETENLAVSELISEVRLLRDEVSGLRVELQEIRRIEHKPESQGDDTWWRFWRRKR